MPKNSAMGPVVGIVGFVLAFGLVWQIGWITLLAFTVAIAAMIVRGFARDTSRIICAAEVQAEHHRWLDAVAAAMPVTRADERAPLNDGLAGREPDRITL